MIQSNTIQKEVFLVNKGKPIAESFLNNQLGCNDVICGRHKDASNNIGNRRFRILVALSIQRYIAAPTRAHKSAVIRDIVEMIQSSGGRFLHLNKKPSHSDWEELDDKQIHDKVGHALRDMSTSCKEKSDIKKLLCPLLPAMSNNIPNFSKQSRRISTNTSKSQIIVSTQRFVLDTASVSINDDNCASITETTITTDDQEDDWTFLFDEHLDNCWTSYESTIDSTDSVSGIIF